MYYRRLWEIFIILRRPCRCHFYRTRIPLQVQRELCYFSSHNACCRAAQSNEVSRLQGLCSLATSLALISLGRGIADDSIYLWWRRLKIALFTPPYSFPHFRAWWFRMMIDFLSLLRSLQITRTRHAAMPRDFSPAITCMRHTGFNEHDIFGAIIWVIGWTCSSRLRLVHSEVSLHYPGATSLSNTSTSCQRDIMPPALSL